METGAQLDNVNAAFSKQSVIFDAIEEENLVLPWMRSRVRSHVLKYLQPGSNMLELNAGTGLDAFFFAGHGHTVLATDLSEGMISRLNDKIRATAIPNVSALQLSYTQLDQLPDHSFDYIFSNFGGLNCVPDLKPVISEFSRLLRPDGMATLVIMPPVAPWEMLAAFKGHFRMAFRRFRKKGALSMVEGIPFITWYFSPRKIITYFGPEFQKLNLEGLCSLVPPPHHTFLPQKQPLIFETLKKWEERIAGRRLFRNFADHFILTMKLKNGLEPATENDERSI